MDVDLRRLRYLLTLAGERHFGRAAALLGIAQPSLSQQIARLEEEVGARLVDRDVRPVALTAAGRVLVEAAGPALDELDAAVSEARRVAGVGRALRVGLPRRAYVRHPRIARLLAETRARLPGSRVEIHELLTREAVLALERGSLDAAVVYAPRRRPRARGAAALPGRAGGDHAAGAPADPGGRCRPRRPPP